MLIELANFPTGRLPDLADLAGRLLGPRMPSGWTDRMLADGRIVLLDGLDEVQPRHREHVERWTLQQLVRSPATRT